MYAYMFEINSFICIFISLYSFLFIYIATDG